MRRFSLWLLSGLLPAALVATLSIGCSGGPTGSTGGAKPSTTAAETKDTGSSAASGPTGKMESKARANLKGRVVIDGTPDLAALDKEINDKIDKVGADKDKCEKGRGQQVWKLAEDKKGLANVVVFVTPPGSQSFKIEADDLDADKAGWKKTVTIDQPACQFEPRITILFPEYRDGTEIKQSGQKFVVANSASIAHNATFKQGGADKGEGAGAIPPGGSSTITKLNASRQPYSIGCGVHPWMSGYVWAFLHPYAAVTDKDGNFEIKNVQLPADEKQKLQIVVWHEIAGFVNGDKGKAVELKAGDNKLDDIKVPVKK